MPVKILEIKQNTPEWLASRKDVVNGSDADVLLTRGLDEALKRSLSTFNGNYYTQRGHILEDEAIELYEAINGRTVLRPGRVINDKYPNAGCSPDAIDGEILIEVKCFGQAKHLEIRKVKDIPFKIMAQLQFNMMICELKMARLVMYNPDVADDKQAYREIDLRVKANIVKNLKAKLEAR